MQDALNNELWVEDIQGEISLKTLLEYLNLWDAISIIELQQGLPDRHIWRFSSTGQYLVKSAYDALFQGATSFGPYDRIWKSWAPPKVSFFHVAGGTQSLLDCRSLGQAWFAPSREMPLM